MEGKSGVLPGPFSGEISLMVVHKKGHLHDCVTSVGKVTKAAHFRLSNITELNKVLAETRVAGNRLFHSDSILMAVILSFSHLRSQKIPQW